MKAEIVAQKKAQKVARKALPSKNVTYKHTTLGEMTGPLRFTKSVKVLPPPDAVFKKSFRPCILQPAMSVEIPPSVVAQHKPTAEEEEAREQYYNDLNKSMQARAADTAQTFSMQILPTAAPPVTAIADEPKIEQSTIN